MFVGGENRNIERQESVHVGHMSHVLTRRRFERKGVVLGIGSCAAVGGKLLERLG